MGKRIRPFRRLAMSAKTAEVIQALANLTHADHASKCGDVEGPCVHEKARTLPVADLITNGIKIGKKRATFDVPDPYSEDDHVEVRQLLHLLATRIGSFAPKQKTQTQDALDRVVEEIRAYADRNPLEVIAEAAR